MATIAANNITFFNTYLLVRRLPLHAAFFHL
jgi:hypothetical protein